jgi:hypothetical protein
MDTEKSTTEANGEVKVNVSSDDIPMEDETEKMQRAAKQSAYVSRSSHLRNNIEIPVEFYFADSNLPFDR